MLSLSIFILIILHNWQSPCFSRVVFLTSSFLSDDFGTSLEVKIRNCKNEKHFQINVGAPQGEPPSDVLFNVCFKSALRCVRIELSEEINGGTCLQSDEKLKELICADNCCPIIVASESIPYQNLRTDQR